LMGFPPLGCAEREKLGESRRGDETKMWPTLALHDDALAPTVSNESDCLIHVHPVWKLAAFLRGGKRASQSNEEAIEPRFRSVGVRNDSSLKACGPIRCRRLPAGSGGPQHHGLVLLPQAPDERQQPPYLHCRSGGFSLGQHHSLNINLCLTKSRASSSLA